jgi:hypothetical protein
MIITLNTHMALVPFQEIFQLVPTEERREKNVFGSNVYKLHIFVL